MNAGRPVTARKMVMRLTAAVVLCLVPATMGLAQTSTPDEACAADSLYLISPPALDLHLQVTGRPGMVVSWPDLDQTQATCFSLKGTEGLAVPVSVSGGFGDDVDRQLRFTAADSGTVGLASDRNLIVDWLNDGPDTYGNLAGSLNLSNNGGVWHYDASADPDSAWYQTNEGLPMSWRRTNVRALARGANGFLVAAFTTGATIDSDPRGLYAYDTSTGTWIRLAEDIFDETTAVTCIVISPGDNNRFAVGTSAEGLMITSDGGQTFTQWRLELDPSVAEPPTNFWVTALDWTGSRILAAVVKFGVFVSEDSGVTFANTNFLVPNDLDAANPVEITPTVNGFSVDPSDSERVLASLLFHGAFESTNGGDTWQNMYGDLVVNADTLVTGEWVNTALDAVVSAADPQVIVMAVRQKGLYRTADGGATWSVVGDLIQPGLATLTAIDLMNSPVSPGTIYAEENGFALLYSDDSGETWELFPSQLALNKAVRLLPGPESGDLTVGTWGGGIYEPGTPLALQDTYGGGTSTELRDLDVGISITFDDGRFEKLDDFELVAQTFQGWAVWRAPSHDQANMTMIGLYDRVNPEDCIEGYCGDVSYEFLPRCFAAKRAACFNFDTPDTIRFFDDEVYNGFAYYYAVTSFDYGNTALDTPESNRNDQLFSPRWRGDTSQSSPFEGDGNLSYFRVDKPAIAASIEEEIYAFPNPVRLGAGIPGGLGEMVVFTNLPDESRVRVFTTAGDDVINLGPDHQSAGQIYWQTNNRDGEQVAAGVYLYLVESPEREDYWGRIVVIR